MSLADRVNRKALEMAISDHSSVSEIVSCERLYDTRRAILVSRLPNALRSASLSPPVYRECLEVKLERSDTELKRPKYTIHVVPQGTSLRLQQPRFFTRRGN